MHKRYFVISLFVIFVILRLSGQGNVGLGTVMPNPSAILDMVSSDKGVLIPRCDTSAIVNPAIGLLIFQTSSASFYYFNGSKWVTFASTPKLLSDDDGDTRIYVEKNPDEDIVRIDMAGQEKVVFNRNASGMIALEFKNSNDNIMIGEGAGSLTNPIGFSNVAVGKNALGANTTGDGNTAIGVEALKSLFTTNAGIGQTAIGYRALYNQTGSDPVTAIGYESAYLHASGGHNTSVGYRSLYTGGGSWNTALGHQALYSNNTFAQRNTGIGFEALYSNVEHDDNTAVGAYALRTCNGGQSNTAVGKSAMQLNISGSQNVALGSEVLFSNSTGSQNSGIGHFALNENLNGMSNTAVGFESLRRTKSSLNTGIGAYSLSTNVNGNSNVAVGNSSLSNTTGSQNTGIGYNSMEGNTSGNSNTALGYLANVSAPNLSNATAIGANSIVGASNCLVLGNGANVGIGISIPTEKLHVIGNGLFSGTLSASCGVLTCSDVRYKKNIVPITNALSSIILLNGVRYNLKAEEFQERQFTNKPQIGLLAQDVELIYPEVVFTDQNGYKAIDYSKLTPVLIEAIKELKDELKDLKEQVAKLKNNQHE